MTTARGSPAISDQFCSNLINQSCNCPNTSSWASRGQVVQCQRLVPIGLDALLLGQQLQRRQPPRPGHDLVASVACPSPPGLDGTTSDCSSPCASMDVARASMHAPAPVRLALAGEGVSLDRLTSMVLVIMVMVMSVMIASLLAAKQRLLWGACLPGPRERRGWRGRRGFVGTRLHGAGALAQAAEAGWKLLRGKKGRRPSAPSAASAAMTRVSDERPTGRDGAYQPARGAARQRGPEGEDAQLSHNSGICTLCG